MTHTDWLPALLMLGLGVVAALGVLLVGRRRRVPPSAAEARSIGAAEAAQEAAAEAGLRATRVLDQLRELEADRHQLTAEAYLTESARLERQAAEALRARDEARTPGRGRKPDSAPARPAASGFLGRHPQLAGAFWGAAVVVFFGALGLWLTQETRTRGAGEGLTGTAGRGETPAAPPDDTAFNEALAHVRETPSDVETSARVVHELIRRQQYDEAQLLTERSLGIDPFFAEARVHRAFLRIVAGDDVSGAQELQRLGDLYPSAYEGFLFLGMMKMRTGDNAGAIDAFDRFVAEAPPEEQPPQMRSALAALRQQLTKRK